ncbi:MAG: hypothetical protein R3E88_18925 [Myxococcota bacterium]|nr:hypothetical protein [Myxococcales bacterium]
MRSKRDGSGAETLDDDGRRDREEAGVDSEVGGELDASGATATAGAGDAERDALEARVREDLEREGVLGDEGTRLASAVVDALLASGPDGYADLLRGIRLAHQVRTDAAADLARSHRELRQLDRLMRGFATELRKLDEVVEVLSAYLRRMRTTAGEATRHTLH